MTCVARRPAAVRPPEEVVDPDRIAGYREDASGAPPGAIRGLVRPASADEAAVWLAADLDRPVLPQGGRTSLTGGGAPRDEWVLSTERLDAIGAVERSGTRRADGARVAVGAGVRLDALLAALARAGWDYPPTPTYRQAAIGGTAATNAGGAATFRHGVTRDWIRGLTVALSSGDLLAVERGEALARPGEAFDLRRADGSRIEARAPTYRLPALKKLSAGYRAGDPLDLVDLLVGSEGTLGAIVEVVLDLAPAPAGVLGAVAFVADDAAAIRLAGAWRAAAAAPGGPAVRSIEWADARSCALLRDEGADRRLRIPLPRDAGSALVVEVELDAAAAAPAAVEAAAAAALEGRFPAGDPLSPFFRAAAEAGALATLDLAWPGDDARRDAQRAFREAVPLAANERARRGACGKQGGDPIVPFDEVGALVDAARRAFEDRGLAWLIWGHLSDGNLHPNALVRDADEAPRAREALLEIGDRAVALGGAPLSEHGVGRNPLKQEQLRRFLGDAALAEMRAIRAAFDPRGRLARGVLVPPADPV